VALKTVNGKVTDPSGAAIGGATIIATLSADASIPGVQEMLDRQVVATAAPDGTWTMQLQANADLTPGTTFYTFDYIWQLRVLASRTAVVPQSNGPFQLSQIQALPPPVQAAGALDAAVVHNTQDEPIDGIKTFLRAPVVPAGSFTEDALALSSWTPADYALKAWTFDPAMWQAGLALTPAGTIFWMRIHIRKTGPVSTLVMFINTAGVGLVAGQCFGLLYGPAPTVQQAGFTSEQSTNWQSTGYKAMALTAGPYGLNLTAGTDVYAAVFYNGTTGPAFGRGGGSNIVNGALVGQNARCGTANTGVTNVAPGALSGMVAANNLYWAALA
jgi:hypothetical protein